MRTAGATLGQYLSRSVLESASLTAGSLLLCRQADLLRGELADHLARNGLPMLEDFPPYLANLFDAMAAARAGQSYVYLKNYVYNIRASRLDH